MEETNQHSKLRLPHFILFPFHRLPYYRSPWRNFLIRRGEEEEEEVTWKNQLRVQMT
jgi:hypothetical protein